MFIDRSNYKKRMEKYLDSPDDPEWERIAEAGRRHATENLSNDRAVEALAGIAKSLL